MAEKSEGSQGGRCVWVTGTSRGIGAAIADRLLRDGHRVVGLCRQPGVARERYHPIVCDFSQTQQLEAQLQRVDAETQHLPAVDALVLNAAAPLFGKLEELSPQQIVKNLETNLLGPILLTRRLLPILKRQPRANLIVIGSESALRGGPEGTIYCAAKFGLRGFAEALRGECTRGSGIAVTMVHPGMVRTPFFDELDFEPGAAEENALHPDEVAQVVAQVLELRAGAVVEEVRVAPLKRCVIKKRAAGKPEQ